MERVHGIPLGERSDHRVDILSTIKTVAPVPGTAQQRSLISIVPIEVQGLCGATRYVLHDVVQTTEGRQRGGAAASTLGAVDRRAAVG